MTKLKETTQAILIYMTTSFLLILSHSSLKKKTCFGISYACIDCMVSRPKQHWMGKGCMWTGKESRGGEEKLALFDSLTFLPIESVASYCTAVMICGQYKDLVKYRIKFPLFHWQYFWKGDPVRACWWCYCQIFLWWWRHRIISSKCHLLHFPILLVNCRFRTTAESEQQ